jgi:hypothetical protein
VPASCDYSNKHLVAIKDGEFLDQLSNYQFLKKVGPPWS